MEDAVKLLGILFSFIILTGMIGSCTDMFTTSLGSWAARDPDSLVSEVTAHNVRDLVEASQDPAYSLALLKKIWVSSAASFGPDKAALQTAALQTAANASGLTNSLLSLIGDLKDFDDAAMIKTKVEAAIYGAVNLPESAAVLSALLPDPGDASSLNLLSLFSDSPDLAMAAVVLLAAEARAYGDTSAYIGAFNASAPGTRGEQLAVQLATAAAAKYAAEGGSGNLTDILGALNLN
jgi:hypothetical protein